MEDASRNILNALKARGYRITEARREMCSRLANAAHPLSIRELAESSGSDEASVYRFVNTLRSEDLVHEITTRGERPRFELKHGHHHHVVCTGCGKIEHVPCAYVPKPHLAGFAAISDHDVTLYGTCVTCA